MPELPEVETVTTALNIAIKNLIVKKVSIYRKDLRFPIPKDMSIILQGKKVIKVKRRAKYGIIDFNNFYSIIFHLGMSGRIIIEKKIFSRLQKHDHIVLEFKKNTKSNEEIRVIYRDPRRFGFVYLHKTKSIDYKNIFKNLGPEPLNTKFSVINFIRNIKNKNTSIKSALLDQKIIAGLGNIYICESLFLSGILPMRLCKALSRKDIEFLYFNIVKVLKVAIKQGGTSLKDYKNITGEIGYFQNFLCVYNRNGKECVNKNCTSNVKRIIQNGRSSFYCQNCQK